MGRIRGWLKRVEHAARGDLDSFELLDGSRYHFDPAGWDLFTHWMECARAGNARDWPRPPEILQKLTEARDVERAVAAVRGLGSFNFIPYDYDVLVHERRLEPRPLVSRYDPKVGKHVPVDPYEDGPEDPSE